MKKVNFIFANSDQVVLTGIGGQKAFGTKPLAGVAFELSPEEEAALTFGQRKPSVLANLLERVFLAGFNAGQNVNITWAVEHGGPDHSCSECDTHQDDSKRSDEEAAWNEYENQN